MVDGTSPTLIPLDLIATMEANTGTSITSIVPRAGGGASRHGAEVVLRHGDGRTEAGYLSYDTRMADPKRAPCFEREVAILKALSGPLAGVGVKAPRFLAADRAHLALLTTLTEGSDKYYEAGSDDAVGRDFVAQLAALHRIDPAGLVLDGFGDPGMPVSARIRQGIADARRDNLASAPDAILLLALDWLEANVPPDRGPAVIVHGDAGPGNFLQHDGRVTALLDWELCHFGDPMEDLAQIWVRSLFQPFLRPSAVFAAYEAAGGITVEVDRVRYHRLYFQVGFMVSAHAALHGVPGMRPASMGVSMLFYAAHMRVIVRSLAELCRQALPAIDLPDSDATWRDRTFAISIDDIHDVVAPRATDQQSAVKAKSLARLIKFWRARDRYGAAYDAAEIAEIAAALGEAAEPTVARARLALAHGVAEGRIGRAAALGLSHARTMRETALMGDGMGSFRDTYFPALD